MDGAEVKFVAPPAPAWRESGISMGMPEQVCTDFAAMFEYYTQSAVYAASREEGLKACADTQSLSDKNLVQFGNFLKGVKDALYPPEATPDAGGDAGGRRGNGTTPEAEATPELAEAPAAEE